MSLNIIRHSTSEYASPVLLVPKKNGEHRLCVDFRKLNSITRKENFPVPNIEETLNSLANKKYFTNLDMRSGYHQIPIGEKYRHLTAFVTPDGHYEYNCMPFGLCNAPAVFMRFMMKVREQLKSPENVIYYMDDILVATETIDQHFSVLDDLFCVMSDANITLNLSKCTFLQIKIKFLGHEISSHGIKPGSDKIIAVDNFKVPESIKEVRQFLGLAGYFRRFVEGFSNIARPISNLLKKNVEFKWDEECQKAFNKLKNILVTRPLLALYDVQAKHEVHTDASSHGLAGILMQTDQQGVSRPVSYFSRATTECEAKYHSYELEALAVVTSLDRFRHYLLNKHFLILTDCDSLRLTQEKRNIIPRIARWWLRLSEFNFDIEYRKGKQMAHVDALSRVPVEIGENAETIADKVLTVGIDHYDWFATLQQQDSFLVEIRKILDGTEKFDGKKNKTNNFKLRDGRVYKITNDGEKFVVPRGVRWRIIKMAHDDLGHGAEKKTIDYIGKYFWFPSMKHVVKKYLASCIDCLYNQRGKDETNYNLHVVKREPIPFHTVHIDHLGPFPKSKSGNLYILGLVCSFTKFVILKAVRNTTTKLVIKMLNEATQYFGVPSRIVSDRGTAFMSKDFKQYCEENRIKHIATAVQTPRGNGQIERYFRTITPAIAAMTKDLKGNDWDKNIIAIQWGLNAMKHSVTGESPQRLLMGYSPKTIMKNKLLLALQEENINLEIEEAEENIPLSELREKVSEKMLEQQQQHADKFNKKHKQPNKYHVGDLVLIRQTPVITGQSKKIQRRFRGPYQIRAELGNDRYVVVDTYNTQITQKPYEGVQSADRLKPWCRIEDLNFDEFSEADMDDELIE